MANPLFTGVAAMMQNLPFMTRGEAGRVSAFQLDRFVAKSVSNTSKPSDCRRLAGRHFRHETAAFAVRSDGRIGNVANYTETSIRVGNFATMACETFMNVGHHSFCSLKELCIGKAGHHSTSVSCLPHGDRITEPLDYEKRILWLTGARRQRGEILPFVRHRGVRIFHDLTAAAADVWGRVCGTISQPIPGGEFPAYTFWHLTIQPSP